MQHFDIICIVVVASCDIYIGSSIKTWKKTIIQEISNESDSILDDDDDILDLTLWHILLIPISSSLMLVLLLYFFQWLQYILLGVILLSSFTSTQYVLSELLYVTLFSYFKPITDMKPSFWMNRISWVITTTLILDWIMTGNYFIHDILASSLAIMFITLVRLPNLKLAVYLLLLLFVYDIYWVFVSEYHFQKNVMVEVATKAATNPIQSIAQYYHIPIIENIKTTIDLPLKLIFPSDFHLWTSLSQMKTSNFGKYSVLGLGDITVPGMLIAFVHDADTYFQVDIDRKSHETEYRNPYDNYHGYDDIEVRGKSEVMATRSSSKKLLSLPSSLLPPRQLFRYGMIGYIIGLLAAVVASRMARYPQPALLYLVPSVLASISFRALWEDRFLELWNGPKTKNQS